MPIFDTDVLIHCERGHKGALECLDQAENRYISCITEMELLQGALSARHIREIRVFLTEFDFHVLPLTENIGYRASLYIEELALSHGLRLTDALIAATAMENLSSGDLVTANVKHFKPISGLRLKPFRP